MIYILLISHGSLAEEMIYSVKMMREVKRELFSLMLQQDETPASFRSRLETKIQALLNVGEVIILSDLVLGTPFNAAAMLMEKYSFCHITGMNIPLLFSVLSACDELQSAECACRKALIETKQQLRDLNRYPWR